MFSKRVIRSLISARYALAALIIFLGLFVVQYRALWNDYVPKLITSLYKRETLATSNASMPIVVAHNTALFPRDDYTCSPGKPCSNHACCGKSGYCGYGPTYCGTACTSNCDAKAECGQYASPAGKTCPLNTCCSEFGFCGTTKDFCTGKCQSNCVLHPQPPGGSTGKVLDKVIGYYESWSDRLACHRTAPGDLPLQALTHVNYAFGYIDPTSFQLVPMDSDTPASLFGTVSNLKQYNSGLKVFISVGGWTFSDNGTATQPVFGNIASTSSNREKFASNVLHFLNQYGFDGIDLDWEYPGAPDRGGQTRDVANFVLLLQTLRQTFDSSSRALGITFTAPSSYWYLRWFDLPELIKYADWINLMTYDLHGVWDRNNPIGSIVQAHTNLTEIKLAVELLWRVKVPPSKIAMGFGFYGRSFELADSHCNTPGCLFSGGAAPGPCSATSGILSYYEIKALLARNPGLKPVHDSEAAVKYATFNDKSWVSYDDADTFKQKVDWANSVGIGGSLIWASDLDDDQYSAHAGLVGRKLGHANIKIAAFSANSISVAQNLIGQNGQSCRILDACESTDARCPFGQTKVGWERGKCGRNKGHSICCPSDMAPSSCIWRGGGGDCNGQCHPGEATLFGSSWGGWPTESNQRKCSRGYKVFCCDAGDWKDIMSSCYWSECGHDCKGNEDEVSTTVKGCSIIKGRKKYCCARPAPLYDCRWVGSYPDCPNAKCAPDEVAIELSTYGNSWVSRCSWGRQLTDCCKVRSLPPRPLICQENLCDIDPGLCAISDDDAFGSSPFGKRSQPEQTSPIERRGGKRPFWYHLVGLAAASKMYSRAYPSRGALFATAAGLRDVIRRFWQMRDGVRCNDTSVRGAPVDVNNLPVDGETEHPIDLQVIVPFIETANRGYLPLGRRTRTRPIPSPWWLNVWADPQGLPARLMRVSPRSPDIRSPADRVMEAFGSNTNRRNFILTQRQINAAKGAIFGLGAPISTQNFGNLAQAGAGGDGASEQRAMQEIRTVIAVFSYANDADVAMRIQNTDSLIRAQFAVIETYTQGGTGLSQLWGEFWPDYQRQVEIFAQEWVQSRITQMRQIYTQAQPAPQNRTSVLATLRQLESRIPDMTFR
ncbi:hypothetical protein EKO27_g2300 [Xylaria grammica]|uniref:chitinase n=1 Tax=Xylaria grammica TaxID=363999 RepID=A0A439DEG4_9PEZI|nr:hypothetical protein EKO27_g2300 [Xylaria grammica]